MYDETEILDRLKATLEILERIPDRVKSIQKPEDFFADKKGVLIGDSVCMVLIAAGETFHRIDDKTHGEWRSRYPNLPWAEIIGVRNILAHGYFDLDHAELFSICKEDVPRLISALRKIINEQ